MKIWRQNLEKKIVNSIFDLAFLKNTRYFKKMQSVAMIYSILYKEELDIWSSARAFHRGIWSQISDVTYKIW